MRYVNLFPPDSRTSSEKLKIIEEGGIRRMEFMESSEEFLGYGPLFWDTGGEKGVGYEGYRYDGRYAPVARKFVEFYGLPTGASVFEVGCGKGFLLVEFLKLGMNVTGIDFSKYAIENAHPDLADLLIRGDFLTCDLPSKAYDLVVAKDCLAHVRKEDVPTVIKRCMSLSRAHVCFDIEVGRNKYERDMLYKWNATHLVCETPEWWLSVLRDVGYSGDYHFKVMVEDPRLPPFPDWVPPDISSDQDVGS